MGEIRIKVNTSVLEEKAGLAEEKIREVRERFERIKGYVDSSRQYWEGEAGDAHRREYQDYQDEIAEALARFQENVTDLRQIAGIYRDVQTEAESFSKDLPVDVIV